MQKQEIWSPSFFYTTDIVRPILMSNMFWKKHNSGGAIIMIMPILYSSIFDDPIQRILSKNVLCLIERKLSLFDQIVNLNTQAPPPTTRILSSFHNRINKFWTYSVLRFNINAWKTNSKSWIHHFPCCYLSFFFAYNLTIRTSST